MNWWYNKVPHINQEKGLFLRGGPHYLCGKTEEDSVKSHQHLVIINILYSIIYDIDKVVTKLPAELRAVSVVACVDISMFNNINRTYHKYHYSSYHSIVALMTVTWPIHRLVQTSSAQRPNLQTLESGKDKRSLLSLFIKILLTTYFPNPQNFFIQIKFRMLSFQPFDIEYLRRYRL